MFWIWIILDFKFLDEEYSTYTNLRLHIKLSINLLKSEKSVLYKYNGTSQWFHTEIFFFPV